MDLLNEHHFQRGIATGGLNFALYFTVVEVIMTYVSISAHGFTSYELKVVPKYFLIVNILFFVVCRNVISGTRLIL